MKKKGISIKVQQVLKQQVVFHCYLLTYDQQCIIYVQIVLRFLLDHTYIFHIYEQTCSSLTQYTLQNCIVTHLYLKSTIIMIKNCSCSPHKYGTSIISWIKQMQMHPHIHKKIMHVLSMYKQCSHSSCLCQQLFVLLFCLGSYRPKS